jgi:hypothetical protein
MGDVLSSIRRRSGIVSGDRLNVSVAMLLHAPLPIAADFSSLVKYFAVAPVGIAIAWVLGRNCHCKSSKA